jgi:putative hydrolase of the HAD superfamily
MPLHRRGVSVGAVCEARPVPTTITFDADQTLVDFRSAMAAALDTALAELRRSVPAAAALTRDDLRRTRDQVARELGPPARMEEIRAAAFRRTLEELGAPDAALADELTRRYLDVRFRELRLYDDVLPALASLDGYALGLVSNGNSYPERTELAGRFGFVVFAHDHGVRKPSAAFYRVVLAAARCTPDELVHVGDSIAHDVDAPQRLGIRAVWLNREGGARGRSGAWAEIESLRELPALLSRGPRRAHGARSRARGAPSRRSPSR